MCNRKPNIYRIDSPPEELPLSLLLRQVVRDNTYFACNSLIFTALGQEIGSLPSGFSMVQWRVDLFVPSKHPKPKIDLKKKNVKKVS